ncbi:MAG: DUF1460 domain-containing protein, partial [Alphaproteobacteria bacterium]|nr:DUF1460 domain-containing protein [Alphaproteobacteria bacterium]
MQLNRFLFLSFFMAACAGGGTPVVNSEYAENLGSISAGFIGKRYAADPLGEGTGFDSDPVIREDAFDCVTFVETVMAMSAPGDATENKIKVSYIKGRL